MEEIIKNHHHFILFKPYGYLSQFINNEERKAKWKMLGDLYDFPQNTMAIGRLDKQSEGLLFLTTDGKKSELVRSNKIEKEYFVQLDGDITSKAISQLELGVEIGFEGIKYTTKPAKAYKLIKPPNLPERSRKIRSDRHGPTSWLSITITEGKYRQVRKMTAAVGFPTLRLVRVRIGTIHIGEMRVGEVKEVSSFL